MGRRRWPERGKWAEVILPKAAEIVNTSSAAMTLRQLFYRLVSESLLVNTVNMYRELGRYTAEGRRLGLFPPLVDPTRAVERPPWWESPRASLDDLAEQYRRDRTEGQETQVWVILEKATLTTLASTVCEPLGIPVAPLRGYTSEPFVREIISELLTDERPAVGLYIGDHDPSGEDIDASFLRDTRLWKAWERVAVTADQVVSLGLPPQMGKAADPRAARFVELHGQLIQVEAEAVPPDTLTGLLEDAIAAWWDEHAASNVLRQEEHERGRLAAFAEEWD